MTRASSRPADWQFPSPDDLLEESQIRGKLSDLAASEFQTHGPRDDLLLAHELVKAIARHSWDGKNEMIGRVHQALLVNNPQTTITRRRVRSFWHKERAAIRHHEMCELLAAAASPAQQASVECA